ncbi:hypothetical protein ACL02S_02175 [Nocardia sp. 004]|uniref:hypothetical protein n=1 Tax=Nocardia sp. 004 TaxID=3385978 RepID=UPI0039A029A4
MLLTSDCLAGIDSDTGRYSSLGKSLISPICSAVGEGRVALDAPVRRYVPEFASTDAVTDEVTVLRLLQR